MDEQRQRIITGAGIIAIVIIIGLSFYYTSKNIQTPGISPGDVIETEYPDANSSAASNPTSSRYIRIISPNSSTTWIRNQQYNISWDTKGVTADEDINVVLISTSTIISNPYTSPLALSGSFSIFDQAAFPQGLPKGGSINYYVPDSIAPGKYQMLIWAGENCSATNTYSRCLFDLSNGLITIK